MDGQGTRTSRSDSRPRIRRLALSRLPLSLAHYAVMRPPGSSVASSVSSSLHPVTQRFRSRLYEDAFTKLRDGGNAGQADYYHSLGRALCVAAPFYRIAWAISYVPLFLDSSGSRWIVVNLVFTLLTALYLVPLIIVLLTRTSPHHRMAVSLACFAFITTFHAEAMVLTHMTRVSNVQTLTNSAVIHIAAMVVRLDVRPGILLLSWQLVLSYVAAATTFQYTPEESVIEALPLFAVSICTTLYIFLLYVSIAGQRRMEALAVIELSDERKNSIATLATALPKFMANKLLGGSKAKSLLKAVDFAKATAVHIHFNTAELACRISSEDLGRTVAAAHRALDNVRQRTILEAYSLLSCASEAMTEKRPVSGGRKSRTSRENSSLRANAYRQRLTNEALVVVDKGGSAVDSYTAVVGMEDDTGPIQGQVALLFAIEAVKALRQHCPQLEALGVCIGITTGPVSVGSLCAGINSLCCLGETMTRAEAIAMSVPVNYIGVHSPTFETLLREQSDGLFALGQGDMVDVHDHGRHLLRELHGVNPDLELAASREAKEAEEEAEAEAGARADKAPRMSVDSSDEAPQSTSRSHTSEATSIHLSARFTRLQHHMATDKSYDSVMSALLDSLIDSKFVKSLSASIPVRFPFRWDGVFRSTSLERAFVASYSDRAVSQLMRQTCVCVCVHVVLLVYTASAPLGPMSSLSRAIAVQTTAILLLVMLIFGIEFSSTSRRWVVANARSVIPAVHYSAAAFSYFGTSYVANVSEALRIAPITSFAIYTVAVCGLVPLGSSVIISTLYVLVLTLCAMTIDPMEPAREWDEMSRSFVISHAAGFIIAIGLVHVFALHLMRSARIEFCLRRDMRREQDRIRGFVEGLVPRRIRMKHALSGATPPSTSVVQTGELLTDMCRDTIALALKLTDFDAVLRKVGAEAAFAYSTQFMDIVQPYILDAGFGIEQSAVIGGVIIITSRPDGPGGSGRAVSARAAALVQLGLQIRDLFLARERKAADSVGFGLRIGVHAGDHAAAVFGMLYRCWGPACVGAEQLLGTEDTLPPYTEGRPAVLITPLVRMLIERTPLFHCMPGPAIEVEFGEAASAAAMRSRLGDGHHSQQHSSPRSSSSNRLPPLPGLSSSPSIDSMHSVSLVSPMRGDRDVTAFYVERTMGKAD